MIVPDTNLLIHAYDTASPHHQKAGDWWVTCLSEVTTIGLTFVVIFAFLRITTNVRMFRSPMSVQEAGTHVSDWLTRRNVCILEPQSNHVAQVVALLEQAGTAGNLVTDAQIAALAIQYGAVVHSADNDFMRFAGVHWFNPLTGAGN